MLANQFRDVSKSFSYNHQNYYIMNHSSIQIYPVKSLIAAAILFCSSFAFGQCYEFDFTDGLMAYYPFNDNANDESGNNWHCVIQETARFLDGKLGKAVYFDGDSDLLACGANFALPDTFSVAAWINMETLNPQWQTVFAKYQTSNYGPFWLGLHYDKVNFWISNGNGGNQNFDSNSRITRNEWHHICWVKAGDKGYIYINGELDAIGNLPDMTDNTDIVTIGRRFEGLIDELRVYDRILTEAECSCLTPTNDIRLGDNQLRISPNPNAGAFTLHFEEETSIPLSISIFNTLGELVKHQELEKGTLLLDFDLSNQGSGVYFLSVQDEAGTSLQTLKILTQ